MIHLDYADGTSEWLTDEQLKEKHPELYASLHRPQPHKKYGERLKLIRQMRCLTIIEMAKRCGCSASELSNVETGREMATEDQVKAYQLLIQEGRQ